MFHVKLPAEDYAMNGWDPGVRGPKRTCPVWLMTRTRVGAGFGGRAMQTITDRRCGFGCG